MTNPIAKAVHCPTCGAPPGRACRPLNPEKTFIVPNHSARKKLYKERIDHDRKTTGGLGPAAGATLALR